ncbi:O-antigen ligase family protein [Paenibacillus sp. An7]|uniref:O-antigen ligase family protein n=1 Tax=Paenibacillus sp. An7 TaxID=2689577 RepID=UPI00135871CD|nr:O-antigen ligase family protein [Paenibacillus sp. An7]
MYPLYSNKFRFFILTAITMVIALLPSFLPLYIPIILIAVIGVIILFLTKEQSILYYGIPFLIIYQLYLPLNLSLTLMVLISLILFANEYLNKNLLRYFKAHNSMKIYFFMLLIMSCAIMYSPNQYLGLKLTFFSFVGLISLCLGFYYRRKELSVIKVLDSIMIIGLPIAITNIFFLVFPELELEFLKSRLAQLFIDPSTLRMLNNGEIFNNILDPYKAGTFFINANVASVYFGLLFCISFSQMIDTWKFRYISSTIIFIGAVLATQSRTGLLALTVVLLIFLILKFSFRTLMRLVLLNIIIVVIVFSVTPQSIIYNLIKRLNVDVVGNDPRVLIWDFTFDKIKEHPFLGLGFGGWESEFPIYALRVGTDPSFPPHNIFVIIWSWAGIPCLILFVLFFINLMITLYTKYTNSKKDVIYLCGLGCIIFVIVQGMFDNFFLHNYSISTLFFFIMGLLLYKEEAEVNLTSETRIT